MAANSFAETALGGSMLVAVPVAMLAGLVSFASPCVLPLVPGYLGYVTGLTGADLQERHRGRVLAGVGLFVLGFSIVFMLIGAVFGQAGAWLKGAPWVSQVLGLVVIVMGVVFLGGLSRLQGERRIHARPPAGLWGAPVLGLTFALGWAPCIGPTFAAVQALSFSTGAGAVRGAWLTFFYCLGLGVPFLVIALALRRSADALAALRRHRLALQRAGGGMLIAVGLLMVSGVWNVWVAALQAWFSSSVRLPI
ncbi:cytochrome C biogenesis protein ResC [Tersicoccus phoenicis]|uniref:Cytochrome C biogenesis protein ResC n=1 Tax=Tersicoccus phoenicis TaxID=554083 RepID=A0A1R1LHJ9_9MICC|nr:cytochrome c biogenesis protein CcdA [Tersicoccus phoenicis]OMH27003.1 cytochrome C biogenesis protein ResC [Tersicoccus phoenicis]